MKRLCPTCNKRRKPELFPKGARSCGICKVANRREEKKRNFTTNRLDDLLRDICRVQWGDMPTCVTCGLTSGYSNPHTNPHGIQVGHYISRAKFILRWDFDNLWPQCSACNRRHEDNPLPFTLFILNKYGQGRLDYFADKLKEYENTKWTTQNRKNDMGEYLTNIKEELCQTLE